MQQSEHIERGGRTEQIDRAVTGKLVRDGRRVSKQVGKIMKLERQGLQKNAADIGMRGGQLLTDRRIFVKRSEF